MTEKSKNKKQPKAKEKKDKETKKKAPEIKQKDKEEVKQKDKEEDKKKDIQDKTEPRKMLPPLDFSSLVLPFYTQALIELGETESPEAKNSEEDLKLTQRLIDLLGLLREKTQGNLEKEEEIFLDQCLHQLRMAYMERVKIISL